MNKLLILMLCLMYCIAFSSFATNIALNKTATASSIQGSGLDAAKAVDGNTGTRWSSASTDNEWIYVNLGSLNYIDTVKIRWENAYASEYKIQFSNDASQWTDAAHITNGANEYRSIPTGHGIAQYVKMSGIHRGTGYGYSIWEFEVIGTCVPPNNNPTNITLSNSSVAENQPSGTLVGTLTTTDPDAGNTFTYSLVSGTGSADNASFTIDGATLKTAASFNYETKSSYSIRLRTTDNYGGTYEKQFTISVTNVNESPTDISLSSNNIMEKQPVGTVVGTLSTADPDANSTFTYTLVAGAGAADNANFTVENGSLRTAAVFDFSVKQSCSIRIRTTDGALSFEKQFTINVKEQNIALGKTATCSSQEGALAPGQAIDGNMSSRWGSGWSDNEWIRIDLANSYAVYKVILRWENAYGKDYKIQTSQDGTNWTEATSITNAPKEDRTITFSPAVTCRYIKMQGIHRGTDWGYSLWEFEIYGAIIPNAAPTDISLSNNRVFQGTASGTVVGVLSTTDPNPGDSHTYSLVSGEGGTDNSSFSINGNQLKTAVAFNANANPLYSVRIRTTESATDHFYYEKQFTVYVLSQSDIHLVLDNFAIYSTDACLIKQNVTVKQGMVGSNSSVELGDNSHIFSNVVAGTTITLRDNAIVDGDAICGSTLTLQTGASVGGAVKQNGQATTFTIPQKTVTPGTQNITVANNATQVLQPGDYKSLMALAFSTVKLLPGVYNFSAFKTEPDVTIEFDLDDASQVVVNVRDTLDLRDRAKVLVTGQSTSNPRAVQFYANQSSVVNIHPYDDIIGVITAPNAEVHIHPNAEYTGLVYAKMITIEPGVTFDGSYFGDSDNDGVPDIVENLPRFRTDPLSIRSYPPIALMKDTAGNILMEPMIKDVSKTMKVRYDFSEYNPDYSGSDSIVMTIPPNTVPLNDIVPVYELEPGFENGTVPSISDTLKRFELVGRLFKLSGAISPSASISLPLPLPDNAGLDIGAQYVVAHYKDDGTFLGYCTIDSVKSRVIYVHAESFSIYAVFQWMDIQKASAYVDDQSVYSFTPGLAEVNVAVEIENTVAESGGGTGIELAWEIGNSGVVTEQAPLTYFVRKHVFKTDKFPFVAVQEIPCLSYTKRIESSSTIKLHYIKFYSTQDHIRSQADPFTYDFIAKGASEVAQGQTGYVNVNFDANKYNNDPALVSFNVKTDWKLAYHNINTVMGTEGRQDYLGTSTSGENSFAPYYYVKDHLGSTRMTVYGGDAGFNMTEATMYESYGAMQNILVNTPVDTTKEKFTGKEFDEDDGLNAFYFGKRYYDPDIGIWLSCDPKDQFYNPYSYSSNPVNSIDPDGGWLAPLIFGLAYSYLSNVVSNAQFAQSHGGSPWNPRDWNWNDPAMSLGFALSIMSMGVGVGMELKSVSSPEEEYLQLASVDDKKKDPSVRTDASRALAKTSNVDRKAIMAQADLATAGSFKGYEFSTSRQINYILDNQFSYKAGTGFLKANARIQIDYLRGNLGFYKAAGKAMTGVGIGFGLIDAAGYYGSGDIYNGGKALWTTAGGFFGGSGGAALLSPTGPGVFIGGAVGSFFGSWTAGALYDIIYGP
jgi:RHS repeat-associated protein